jgi:cysteine-rich repeat protein
MTFKTAITLTLLSCLLPWGCDTKTKNVDSCGDGFVDPGEQCDTTVGENSCASLGYYNALGTLTCTSDCQFDDSSCGGRCGDSLVQEGEGETCDGGNLNGQTCQSLGYGGGTLACGAECAYDTDGCTNVCGNGLVEGDEGCDDDGVVPGDGCSATCTVEDGWECAGTSPSLCTPICGDGQLVGDESCDGANLDQKTCESLNYHAGTLVCASDCTLDTSDCEAAGRCGDGELQGGFGEVCDGAQLDGATCESLGYHGGTLACASDCLSFNLTSCEAQGRCGDTLIQTNHGEVCDDQNLAGQSCTTLGYHGGTLACASDCLSMDLTSCAETGQCGDGLIQVAFGEVCDADQLNGQTCLARGYYGGTLACNANCQGFNETQCLGRCGDGVVQTVNGEECEGSDPGGQTCTGLGFYEGTLACNPGTCRFVTTGCTGSCGDFVVQAAHGEECDRTQLDSQTCQSQGYYPGTLACDAATCQFDFNGCAGRCGDGTIQSAFGEVCDSSALGGQTCEGLGLYNGTLACGSNCQLVTTGCGGRCGDGVAQTTFGEDCDVVDLAGETCVSQGYHPGMLGCDPGTCRFVFTDCGGSCGDGIIQTASGEVCDTDELGDATCATEGFYEGTLTCGSNCQLVTGDCSGQCGDGSIQLGYGEDCEGSNLGGQTCASLGYSAPRSGALNCLPGCVFDESACVPIGSNSNLATLSVSSGNLSPEVSSSTTSFYVTVAPAVASITVTATAADAPYATVEISPAQPMTLMEGENPVTVTVTAEDGTQKEHTVVITRLSLNDYLSPHIGGLKFVPAGTFQRDATATNLSQVSAFRMSQYEITRAQWVAVTGWTDPSNVTYSSGSSDPVQMVSWYDAIAFCNKLSLLEGLTPVYAVSGVDFATLTYAQIPTSGNATWNAATVNWAANGYRLPTEMEWMWAAMGADTANPGAVNTTGYLKAFSGSTGSNLIGDYAVFGYGGGETGRTTTLRSNPAGSKLAAELGFHDLSGNVGEWVWDWWGEYPTGTLTDYRGPASGPIRVLHGGNWLDQASYCAVAEQSGSSPHFRNYPVGIRVVRP